MIQSTEAPLLTGQHRLAPSWRACASCLVPLCSSDMLGSSGMLASSDPEGPFGRLVWLPGTPVTACFTTRLAGDLRDAAGAWWRDVLGDLLTGAEGTHPVGPSCPGRVVLAQQVHGAGVAVVGPGDHEAVATPASGADAGLAESLTPGAGVAAEADALVSGEAGTCLGVLSADCVPIALGSPEGMFAAVHAGWRGLAAGVVESAVTVLRSMGATRVAGAAGACIGPCCYEFSPGDLDVALRAIGGTARSFTRGGRAALDLRAGVREACARSGVDLVWQSDACTACGEGWYSYRARGDEGRQGVLVWRSGA